MERLRNEVMNDKKMKDSKYAKALLTIFEKANGIIDVYGSEELTKEFDVNKLTESFNDETKTIKEFGEYAYKRARKIKEGSYAGVTDITMLQWAFDYFTGADTKYFKDKEKEEERVKKEKAKDEVAAKALEEKNKKELAELKDFYDNFSVDTSSLKDKRKFLKLKSIEAPTEEKQSGMFVETVEEQINALIKWELSKEVRQKVKDEKKKFKAKKVKSKPVEENAMSLFDMG